MQALCPVRLFVDYPEISSLGVGTGPAAASCILPEINLFRVGLDFPRGHIIIIGIIVARDEQQGSAGWTRALEDP
jgi:hypothetical protein